MGIKLVKVTLTEFCGKKKFRFSQTVISNDLVL